MVVIKRDRLVGAALALFLSLIHQTTAQAQDRQVIRVGTIIHNPPYVFVDPSAGIDVDTIAEALEVSNIGVEFIHSPLTRLGLLLDSGRVDAMTAFRALPDQCALSEPYGYWHNGIIVPASLDREINGFSDLKGLKVGMFPQAKNIFGVALRNASADFATETTVFTTPPALRMLEYGRLDAYIGDSWGLDYLYQQQAGDSNTPPYRVAYAFDPTPTHLCFADGNIRDAFNDGLIQMKTSGKLGEIISRYRR